MEMDRINTKCKVQITWPVIVHFGVSAMHLIWRKKTKSLASVWFILRKCRDNKYSQGGMLKSPDMFSLFYFQCGKWSSTKVIQITYLAVQKMEVYGIGMDLTLMHLLWLLAREKVLIDKQEKTLIYYVKAVLLAK